MTTSLLWPPRREVLLLVAASMLLVSWGGTPFYHPDSIVVRAMHVLTHGGDPDFFRYPGLVIYGNALVYGIIYLFLHLFHAVSGMDEFQRWFLAGTFPGGIPFHLPALFLTYVCSALGIVFIHAIALIVTRDRIVAFLAAMFTATSLLWGGESHFTTVDMPTATMILASLFATASLTTDMRAPSRRAIGALGLLLGLSVSAKYTAVLVVIPMWASISICEPDRARRRSMLLWFLAMAALAFVITNPFAFAKPGAFLHQAFDEAAHGMRGHFGWQHGEGHLYHLQTSLVHAVGTPLLLLAAVGFFALWRRADIPRSTKRAILLFPIVYYAIVGGSKLGFERYMLPLVPFAGLFAAWGLHEVAEALRPRLRRGWMHPAILIGAGSLLAAPNLVNLLIHDAILARTDTRHELRALLDSSSASSTRTVFGGHYVQRALTMPVSQKWEVVATETPDIVAMDSFSHDRFLYDPFKARPFPARRSDFVTASVFQISPYRRAKEAVPFSPQSVYSPYPPDLAWRRAPGPYIELYIRSDSLADSIERRAQDLGITYSRVEGCHGYYIRNFQK